MQTLTVTPREAARILSETHGLKASGELLPLGSELASTFKATAGSRDYAVKIQASGPKELPVQLWRATVASRLSAQGHPVPPTLPTRERTMVGTATNAGRPIAVTVSEWIAGTPYGEIGHQLDTVSFGRALGSTAAKLQSALIGSPRPPRPITHTWAAHTMAETIEAHLPRVTDLEIREIAARTLDILGHTIAPVAGELPRVLVHQDLHDSNVLADTEGGIAALLDFDDMLVGWRVAEPAIAAAYLARHASDPRGAVSAVSAGWEASLPFTDAERHAYRAMVLARLALNAVVWNVRAGDDRAAYAELRSAGTEATFHTLDANGWAEGTDA